MTDAQAFNHIAAKLDIPPIAVVGGSMNHDLLILLDVMVGRIIQLEEAQQLHLRNHVEGRPE